MEGLFASLPQDFTTFNIPGRAAAPPLQPTAALSSAAQYTAEEQLAPGLQVLLDNAQHDIELQQVIEEMDRDSSCIDAHEA